ncbi:hypothetical protein IC582_015101 [Cucumis melo]|uniref:Acidic leucine-rich nuclear phosphoprotein 32 family member B n=3 Tax=Cucumis melo TaxID=3656 RepID=A0A5A7UB54_CUCMM|nr:hypothetical protein [Cucumis melo subsp. melo]KAA0052962.1 acidic leucine-rich nuclear phosphoprotein 32 family member B [Cucumis melo var. makuwa]TYK11418.1 acidic leucine-rich nuclear phosphoprotein 32 family member B [Cucumis melo var. makuwa]
METPSSIRRVTRSQTLSAANSVNNNNVSIPRKVEECDNNGLSKSRQRNRKSQDLGGVKGQDNRSALIDITNDSPIVGLAAGSLMTPISSVTKQRSCRPKMMTPGSGEALLRGQVKTLLQKVEEEAEISKLSLESRPFVHLQSPAGLLAPTPANTPQINLSQDENLCSITSHPIVEEQTISQVAVDIDLFNGKKQEENQINRSLLLDFSEKSETNDDEATSSDCSSVLTHQDKFSKSSTLSLSPSQDDDNSSLWSIQVNASSHDEDEEDEDIEEEEEEDVIEDEEDEEGADYDGGLVDELCKGISKISVNEKGEAEEFVGKHTRFVYNSEDEMIEEVSDESRGGGGGGVSPSILRLKGMPTPKGKHLRFGYEEE